MESREDLLLAQARILQNVAEELRGVCEEEGCEEEYVVRMPDVFTSHNMYAIKKTLVLSTASRPPPLPQVLKR